MIKVLGPHIVYSVCVILVDAQTVRRQMLEWVVHDELERMWKEVTVF
jgi:hypothetical protein